MLSCPDLIMLISTFLLFCVHFIEATNWAQKFKSIPSFLKICHRSDPDINHCVKDSIEKLRPYLIKGIPEFGIPSCEPLMIPEIVLNQGKGPVSIQSTYTNIHITGASQFIIKNLRIDPENGKVRVKLWLPFLYMISDYELDGRILMLPISGSGVCEGNYTNVEARILMEGKKFEKRGKEFFDINKFKVRLNVGSASVQLNDLFDGDEFLGKTMNTFVNDNWDTIVKEISPILEDSVADIGKNFANNIYHKYPLDTLLPP